MYASTSGNKDSFTNGTVPLTFKHALTQVRFTACTVEDDLTLVINKNGIKLNNLSKTASFSLNATAEGTGWSNFGTEKTTYIVASDLFSNTGKTSQQVDATDDVLILLPQTFPAYHATAND